jgi:DHA1 family bicyclomycin/chloramphenicol resistance-like MFS transporter
MPAVSKTSFREFVALAAMMISLVALSTDTMLPALSDIGRDLLNPDDNANQLIISLFFLGLAFGQLIYGPLSDQIGRKPAIFIGLLFYIIGCLLSFFAMNFPFMLMGRILQGVGAAGPRIVIISMVRDQYSGRAMARVMSFVMTVFIFTPIVAPGLGQAILLISHWRAIFGAFLLIAMIATAWFTLRQPETLSPEHRISISIKHLISAAVEIMGNRRSGGYTITAGIVGGAFLGYLNMSQQIFQQIYGLGALFPVYFGILAVSIGFASFLNARLVMRFGMRRLCLCALVTIVAISAAFEGISLFIAGHPNLWGLMAYMLITLFCIGFLFGNLNALAMEPLGHIAGIGAAVVGAISTGLNMIVGTIIGQSYNDTIIPLVSGFFFSSIVSLILMGWIEKRK